MGRHTAKVIFNGLTTRDFEMLALASAGHEEWQLAGRYGMSQTGIRTRFYIIRRTLGVRTQAEAIDKAVELNLMPHMVTSAS